MKKSLVCALLFTCMYSSAQTELPNHAHPIPILRSAELPQYPPIAKAARVTGSITVRVNVEGGKVTQATVVSEALRSREVILKADFKPLSEVTLANVRSWRFDPAVNEAFTVIYRYDISGGETDDLTNPKIEGLPWLT